MKATILLALTLITGCADAIPVYLVSFDSDIQPVTRPSPEVKGILDGAFNIWGLTYDLVPAGTRQGTHGALQITIIPKSSWATIKGTHDQSSLCEHDITAMPDTVGLAHEIGHAWLGPDHSDDPDNLMFKRAHEWGITDEQWDDAEREISLFKTCLDGA